MSVFGVKITVVPNGHTAYCRDRETCVQVNDDTVAVSDNEILCTQAVYDALLEKT